MQRIIFLITATIFLLSGNVFADSKKIIKWVDSSGVTHYGDKLPAQEAGRKNSEMNTQDIVIKQNNLPTNKNEALDQQQQDQARKDKILLASYTKPEEIDAARDRNLQMDQAAIQALTSQKESAVSRTARNTKTAESFRARNKPIPPYLADELNASKAEIANIDKQMTQRKTSMEATKTHYAEEKARFNALKQANGGDATTVAKEASPSTGAPSSEVASAQPLHTSKTLSSKQK